MPRGDKSKYTDKQERKADHIAEGYEKRGVSEKEAERRAWATVNKDDGGGKKAGGSGRGKETGNPAAHKGGRKGGRAAAEEFMKHLKVAIIATHVADAHTCVLHPASSTHRQLTDEQLVACGVEPGLIRLSCGLEDPDDIIADLEQALAAI